MGKDIHWKWGQTENTAFNMLKDAIGTEKVTTIKRIYRKNKSQDSMDQPDNKPCGGQSFGNVPKGFLNVLLLSIPYSGCVCCGQSHKQ